MTASSRATRTEDGISAPVRVLRTCAIVALLGLLLSTCTKERTTTPVILISIDTLRADHLPAYGYRAISTPALDAFRRDAVLFERAYSHSPLTLPSHATILSGQLPAEHGVRDNVGFTLGERTPMLPAILKSNGYATGAAISAYVLRKATGIARGFDAYDDDVEQSGGRKALGAVQRHGEETAAVAQQWIAANAQQPFFYFLHLYEPHAPYEPTYDAEIVRSDAILGKLFAQLKASGLYDDALIVVLADHGEGLGDHGEEEHGIFLYREAIHVPLLIKLPKNARGGSSVAAPVGLADVTPTILRILGIDAPKTDGRALLARDEALTLAPRAVYSETWYPRFHFGWSDLHSLVDGDEHFIEAPRPELYDMAADAAEKRNLVEERRRRFVAMRQALAPLRREASAPSAVSAEEAQKLAALGYIGSAAPADGKALADPKDKIGAFHDLRAAFTLYRQGRDEEALAAFDRLLVGNPDMIDLWDVRSKVLFRLGRTNEAIESGKEALRRSSGAAHLAVDLANELLLAGRVDDAKAHAELAVRNEPAKAHELLARIALLQNDLATAEREAKLAGDGNAAQYTLARVAQRKGDFEEVVRITDALVKQPEARPLVGLHALRGDALARVGREAEAEAALREEIRLRPADPDAYRSLIVLLVAAGRTDEATNTVLALAAASPNARTYRIIADTLRVIGDEDGARYWMAKAR